MDIPNFRHIEKCRCILDQVEAVQIVKNSLFVPDTVLLSSGNNKSKAGSLTIGKRETELMAKGNDGNYLQHCIEVEAAVRLAGMDTAGKLHIALTHGMRPFEPFDKRGTGIRHELLLRKLADANNKPQAEEPAVVKAYRETGASKTRYPNSAELLRVIIGTENLSGGITEMCSRKHKSLFSAWINTNVKTACASWREEVHPEGILACPDDLQTPWLFSIDPMTYSERGDKDKNLNGPDIDI